MDLEDIKLLVTIEWVMRNIQYGRHARIIVWKHDCMRSQEIWGRMRTNFSEFMFIHGLYICITVSIYSSHSIIHKSTEVQELSQ